MLLHCALLAGLVAANGGTNLPPRPDFASLIPLPSASFIGRVRDNCAPDRREAVALAKYLYRIWDVVAALDACDASNALDLLTVVQQFDTAVMVLNPNPTVGEAMVRICAYQPILALVRREIKRDDANPKPLGPARLNQLHAQLKRMNLRLAQQYGPVFARAVLPLRFG